MLLFERGRGTQEAERATVGAKTKGEIFTITFTLFLPFSFKGLTVLKEKLQGNDHSRDSWGRPLGCEKEPGTPCGAASADLAAATAFGCRRNPCARPLLQLGAGPQGGGRVCACVAALPARAEAGAASGSAGTWRVDPLATPVE